MPDRTTPRLTQGLGGAALAVGAAAALAVAAAARRSPRGGSRSAPDAFPAIERMPDGVWRMWQGYKEEGSGRRYFVVDHYRMEDLGLETEDIPSGMPYAFIIQREGEDDGRIQSLKAAGRRARNVLERDIVEIRLPQDYPDPELAGTTIAALLFGEPSLGWAEWLDGQDVSLVRGRSYREEFEQGVLAHLIEDSSGWSGDRAVSIVEEICYPFITERARGEIREQIKNNISEAFEQNMRTLDVDEYPLMLIGLMLESNMISLEDIQKDAVRDWILRMAPDHRGWMFWNLGCKFGLVRTVGGKTQPVVDGPDGPIRLASAFGLSAQDMRQISQEVEQYRGDK